MSCCHSWQYITLTLWPHVWQNDAQNLSTDCRGLETRSGLRPPLLKLLCPKSTIAIVLKSHNKTVNILTLFGNYGDLLYDTAIERAWGGIIIIIVVKNSYMTMTAIKEKEDDFYINKRFSGLSNDGRPLLWIFSFYFMESSRKIHWIYQTHK